VLEPLWRRTDPVKAAGNALNFGKACPRAGIHLLNPEIYGHESIPFFQPYGSADKRAINFNHMGL
jgi:hypothetical protein